MESSQGLDKIIDKIRIMSGQTAMVWVGEFKIKISIDDLVKQKYKKGMVLTDVDWRKMTELSVAFLAKNYSLKLLSYGAKSETQLARKIKTKVISWFRDYKIKGKSGQIDLIVDDNLNFLKQRNFVNDQAYIESILRRYRHKSNKEIYFMLTGKGIDKGLINKLLVNTDARDKEAIRIYLSKKVKDSKFLDKAKKMSLLSALYRRGFSVSLVKREIDDLIAKM